MSKQTLDEAVQAVKLKAKRMYDIDLNEAWLKEKVAEIMDTELTTRCQVLYLAVKYNW